MTYAVARPVEAGDIDFVAAHLCAGELMTMRETYGPDVDVRDRIAGIVLRSANTLTAVSVEDGTPLSLIGVVPLSLLDGQGSLWFIATEGAFRHPGTLVRAGRKYVREMLGQYEHLVGRVDSRHAGTLKLVRLLGFTVHEPKQEGSVQFCYYEMRRDHVRTY